MQKSFQVKPGIVMPVDNGYQLIVGEGRYLATRLANIPYYRAFVIPEMSKQDRLFIQAIEDLSEKDTFMDQARKIDHIYRTHKDWYAKQGKRYLQETFLKEFSHLASPKVMRHALIILQLPQDVQYFMDEGILSKQNGLLLGNFAKETRFELLYSFLAKGYTNNQFSTVLKKSQEQSLAQDSGLLQSQLFDVPRSYQKSYEQLTAQLGFTFKSVLRSADKLESFGSTRPVYMALGRSLQKLDELKALW